MKYEAEFITQFKKDLELAKKQNKDLDKLFEVVNTLADGGTLDAKYHDQDLSGNYKGTRECHIEPDWLLVYEIRDDVLVLMLYRLGLHSELFKKLDNSEFVGLIMKRFTFESPLVEGVVEKRKSQFTMLVSVDGQTGVSCHCPTTGRVGNLDLAGRPCLLSKSSDPKRKTPYTVEAISLNRPEDTEKSWIGINQNAANRYVEYYLSNGGFADMVGTENDVQREKFRVLMENYDSASKYMETAANSAGTAEAKFGAYLDSIDAKTKSAQAAFESLAVNSFSTNTLGGIIDASGALVTFLDKTNLVKGALSGLVVTGVIQGFTSLRAGVVNAAVGLEQFSTAMNLVKAGEIGKSEMEQLVSLTGNLSQSQLQAVVSAQALSTEQRMAILSASGLSTAEADAAMAAMGLSAAEGAAAGTTATLSGVLSGLWATLMANPLILVATGVTAAVAAFSAYNRSVQEQINSAKEAGASWESTSSSLADYKSRVMELRTSLDSGTLSEEETYAAKAELLSIQQSLIDTYGDQASGISLVTGAYEDQLAAIDNLASKSASEFLNENTGGIEKATEEMEKIRAQTLGTVFSNDETGDSRLIRNIADKYDHIDIVDNGDGYSQDIVFKGDASQAKEELNGFMTDLSNAESEAVSTDFLSGFSESAERGLDEANDVLDQYQDIYKQAQQANMVADTNDKHGKTSAQWLSEYSVAIQDYNDALASGNTSRITEAKNAYDSVNDSVQNLLTQTGKEGLGQYSSMFDEVAAQLDTTTIKALDFADALRGDKTDKTSKSLKTMADNLKGLGLTNVDLINGYNAGSRTIRGFIEAAERAGYVTDTSAEGLQQFASQLTEIGILDSVGSDGISSTVKSVDELQNSLDTAIDNVSKLQTALSESTSGTGLSSDSISNIESMYSGLKGYDTETLFEKTAHGVHLNSQAMKELNKQYEANQKLEYQKTLEEYKKQLDEALTARDALNKKENRTEWNAADAKVTGLQNQISEIQNLAAQYDGLTSAFNKWQQAQSGSNERDSWESLASGYDSMKDILNAEWYNDKSLNAYLDTMLSVGSRTGDAVKDFAKLKQTIDGTSNSIKDYFTFNKDDQLTADGLVAFVSDVNKVMGDEYAKLGKNGWEFEWDSSDIDAISEKFGIGTEAIELMVQAMGDLSSDIHLDTGNTTEYAEKIATLSDKAKDAIKSLRDMQDSGKISSDIDLNFDTAKMSVDEIDSKIKELEDEKVKLNVDADKTEVDALDTEIDYLNSQKISLNVAAQIQNGHSIQDLLNMDDATLAATLDIDSSQVDEARAKLQSLDSETAETSVTVKIDESQFSQLISADKQIQVDVTGNMTSITPPATIPPVEVAGKMTTVNADTQQQKSINVNANITSITPPSASRINATANITSAKAAVTPHINANATITSITPPPAPHVNVVGTLVGLPGVVTVGVTYYTAGQANPTAKTASVNYKLGNQAKPKAKTAKVNYTLGSQAAPKSKSARVNYTLGSQAAPKAKTAKVNYVGKFNGTANAQGTAHASGNWSVPSNQTSLINELGREIVVRNGKWFDVNNGYPAFTKLKKGDIVFNHKQTEQLFKNGFVTGSHARILGSSFNSGTALAGGTIPNLTRSSRSSKKAYSARRRSKPSTKPRTSQPSGSSGTSKLSSKTQEDWIERIFKKLEAAVDKFSAIAGNAVKTFSTRTKARNSEISNYQKLATKSNAGAAQYLKEANRLGLKSSYIKKIQDGTMDVQWIQSQTSSGKEKNKELLNKISEYIDLYDKYKEALQQGIEAEESLSEAVADRANLIASEWEGKIATKITNKIDALETSLKNNNTTHSDSDYQKLINYYNTQASYLDKEAAALQKQLNADVKNGYIKKGTEAWYDRQKQIDDVTQSANEARVAQQEAANQRWDNIKNRYEAKLTQYDTTKSLIDTYMDTAEKQGYADSTVWYKALQANSEKNIKQLTSERDALLAQLKADIASKDVQVDGKEYNSRISEIDDLTVKIAGETKAIADYSKEINDIKWDSFDRIQDKIEEVIDEADFFIKLMSSSDLKDEAGNLTAEGEATIALHVKNMELYSKQSKNYADEIKSINKSLAEDPYNQDLLDRRSKLIKAQQKAIQAAQDEKDEIKDLVSKAYDSQLDSLKDIIDKYTDALEAQKDLYDYQKKVREQTKNIVSIQKQLSAYQGDTSEETKQKIQKLKVDLESAKSDLEETQYDKYVSDQKQMLNDFYDDYESAVSTRLDDTDALIQGVIDSASTNTASVNSTLTSLANSLGYTISSALSNSNTVANNAKSEVTAENDAADKNAHLQTTDAANSSANITSQKQEPSKSGSVGGNTAIPTGKTQTITTSKSSYTVAPGKSVSIGAKAATTLTYSSSNPSIAKVSSSGKITGIADGKATIRINAAEASGYKSATKTVSVTVKTESVVNDENKTKSTLDALKNQISKNISSAKNSSKNNSSKTPTVGKKVKFASGSYYNTAAGKGILGSKHRGEYVYITKVASSGSHKYHISTGSKLGSGDLGWVKASQIGFSKGGFVADYQKIAMKNGDDMVAFNTLKRGEAVLNPAQTKQFQTLVENLPLMNNLVDTTGMVQKLRGDSVTQNITNNYETNINIDHVEDYDDFMTKMQGDRRFEKMIHAMTIDRAMGKSELGKYKIKF